MRFTIFAIAGLVLLSGVAALNGTALTNGTTVTEDGGYYAPLDTADFRLVPGPLERGALALNEPLYWTQELLVVNDGEARAGFVNLLSQLPDGFPALLRSVSVTSDDFQAETVLFPLTLAADEERTFIVRYETAPVVAETLCTDRSLAEHLPEDARIDRTSLPPEMVVGKDCTLTVTHYGALYTPVEVPLPGGATLVRVDGLPSPLVGGKVLLS